MLVWIWDHLTNECAIQIKLYLTSLETIKNASCGVSARQIGRALTCQWRPAGQDILLVRIGGSSCPE